MKRAFAASAKFADAARQNFFRHSPFQAAAALSFYSLISLAPIVIIIVAVAGFLISDADVQSALIERVRTIANDDAAEVVRTIIENTANEQRGVFSIIVAACIMVAGATTAFAQLHAVLNRVWNVPVKRRLSILHFVKGRLWSFVMLIVIGVLLAVSLVFSTFLASIGDFVSQRFGIELIYWEPLKLVTSYGFTTVLIAMIYKYLPETQVHWRDALVGAVAASLLFELSKWAVGYYVARMDPESAFGAAGSVIVFMVWIYAAALIVLIGTEIARTCAEFRAPAA
ncbi:MAG TPA: YihY/virulence factor BrkB family protein [Gammaproteobacteria bacterium]|nr:YihY/virulence factor BrkB family protein [Gammaproteobacteria bacterium]